MVMDSGSCGGNCPISTSRLGINPHLCVSRPDALKVCQEPLTGLSFLLYPMLALHAGRSAHLSTCRMRVVRVHAKCLITPGQLLTCLRRGPMTAAAVLPIGRQPVTTALIHSYRFLPHALRVDGGLGDIHKCLYNQPIALTIDKAISGIEFEVQA